MSDHAADGRADIHRRGFALLVLAITAVRVAGLVLTPLGLHPDEAQYWTWSRTFDWGYFSKPPLVAWTIAATTTLFGNDPWAVRIGAPLAHAGAAFALFAVGRRMYGPAAGWWAGLSWLLIPGVWLSSAVLTTDALLLPVWSLALLAAWRWVESRAWRWALVTGALVGLGVLAKYAMLFFPVCAIVAALWSPAARRAFVSAQALGAMAVAALVVAPNLAWNATHHFETFAHTAANANWQGALFNPGELASFVTDQFAVAGALALALILALTGLARAPADIDDRARFLVAFAATPLAIILAQALISRAHGNWAASAWPAAIVLVAGRFAGTRALRWANALHAALFAVFLGMALAPAAAFKAPLVGRGIENGLKRIYAWDRTADAVAAQARAATGAPYTAILVDHRHLYCELVYAFRNAHDLPPVRMYVLRGRPGNQAEAAAPMTADVGAHVLVVHMSPRYEHFVAGDFAHFRTFARMETPIGPRKRRAMALSEASGFRPVPRSPAFLAEVGN